MLFKLCCVNYLYCTLLPSHSLYSALFINISPFALTEYMDNSIHCHCVKILPLKVTVKSFGSSILLLFCSWLYAASTFFFFFCYVGLWYLWWFYWRILPYVIKREADNLVHCEFCLSQTVQICLMFAYHQLPKEIIQSELTRKYSSAKWLCWQLTCDLSYCSFSNRLHYIVCSHHVIFYGK